MAAAALALTGGLMIIPTQLEAESAPAESAPVVTAPATNGSAVTLDQASSPATAASTSALCAGPAPVTPPAAGLTGTHWVDVDLTTQIATLYIGSTSVQTFCVSTGGPGLATPTGTFSVLEKIPVATYSSNSPGDSYYYPNVKWSVEFKSPYYFHTAYWNNSFGIPVSHGCVNMREADAKVLYDFVSIGNKVVIHD